MKLSVATFLAVCCASTSVFAYTFDDMCAPKTQHSPVLDSPRVGFMLDESTSMSTDSSTPGLSRWDAAVAAISETVVDFTQDGPSNDSAQFGLGVFGSGASWLYDAQENSHEPGGIPDILAAHAYGGSTNIGDGAEELEGENSLDTSSHPNYGVIITDGAPNGGCFNSSAAARQQMVDAVDALCDARSRGNSMTTYVIGYGTAFTSGTNSMLAAAGGTGTCCDAADCNNNPIDVCALDSASLGAYLDDAFVSPCNSVDLSASIQCSGAIDAVTNADLKNAIQNIVQNAVCTFPLDIPGGYPGGAALPDPTATLVEMHHNTFSDPDVGVGFIGDCAAPMGTETRDAVFAITGDPVIADQYIDEGWCWATPARTIIQLTPQLCGEISAGDITEVSTQVACPCTLTGQPCTITSLNCLQPDDTMGPCTNPQLTNMPCSEGIYACIAGSDVCQATGAAAIYEICNGVDDNCDGRTDNIAETYGDWPDPNIANGKHCNGSNACNCPNGAKEAVTYDGNINTALTTNWTGACVCESGLEAGYDEQPSASSDADQASCAVAAKDQRSTFFLFAIVLGLLGFSRRRLRA